MRPVLRTILSILLWQHASVSAKHRCYTGSNSTTIYSAHNLDPSPLTLRAASALTAQLAQPWPLVDTSTEQLHVIKYCYASKLYRDYLHCSRVNPALKMWADKLGAPAAQHGHSVAFKEAGYAGRDGKRKRAYCYSSYENGKGGKWNKNVDRDTLAIYLDPTFDGARATTGWSAGEEPGRHETVLAVDADSVEIAHELRHVFGTVHEQVRNDRDEYVKYECRHVQRYADALSEAMATEGSSEAETHQRLCEDRSGSQFTNDPRGKFHDEPGGFDLSSITLYSSDVFGDAACETDASKCPLLKYVKVNGDVIGTNRILENAEPSGGDITWLKMHYPAVDGGPSES